VLADAVQQLWPGTQLAFGPPIEDGFYYDFHSEHTFTPEDFPAIEAKMAQIVAADHALVRSEPSSAEARAELLARGEVLKVEHLDELITAGARVSFYRHGDFADLCVGGHVPSTGWLAAFKLQRVSGAHWKGNEHGPRLQRIYGTAFFTRQQLDDHLQLLEEAKRRDHRILGPQLGLFRFIDEGVASIPFYLPHGTTVVNQLLDFSRKLQVRRGYQEIRTPTMLALDLWKRSGHFANYQENMYFIDDPDLELAVKPMNCPGCVLVYKSERRSYRDLPLKLAEYGLVHRREMSGVVHGLFRTRGFTQDDAHIFCTPEQVKEQVIDAIELVDELYSTFDLPVRMELSTRPERSIGSDEMWARATTALRDALDHIGREYQVNEGDGAFYGPKIDIHIKDSLKRSWQCGTIQVDFSMPSAAALDCSYVGADGSFHVPVMIHRAIFGSLERFFGILIEHYAGVLPLWLAPVQVVVMTITDAHRQRAEQIHHALQAGGVRSSLDLRNEKIGLKIREATLAKAPWMVVVGDDEVATGQLAVRELSGTQRTLALDAFLDELQDAIASRRHALV
jgi:threonyl-tRNA synthetase